MTELIQTLIKLFRTNNFSSFFINGLPGIGKTTLLNQIAENLPIYFSKTSVLGPYNVEKTDRIPLGARILEDLVETRKLSTLSVKNQEMDLAQVWEFASKEWELEAPTNILLLIDLINLEEDLFYLSNLFSQARYLEGTWQDRRIRILCIFAGFWDHTDLFNYYERIQTSHPYISGSNYLFLDRVSQDEISKIIEKYWHYWPKFYSAVINDLSGGHPGITIEIIKAIKKEDLSLKNLLDITKRIAAKSAISDTFVDCWKKLPEESKSYISKLFYQKVISTSIHLPQALERLRNAGLVRVRCFQNQAFLEFSSWFVELILYLHSNELGLSDIPDGCLYDELIPRIPSISIEGYKLINEIENLTRNFVSMNLAQNTFAGEHFLEGHVVKYNSHLGREEDAFTRAEDWRMSNEDRGVIVDYNPLIAYLSTKDLALLLEEISLKLNSPIWKQIADTINDLTGIRDAVMHNQLIDEDALQKLYSLQETLYLALSS